VKDQKLRECAKSITDEIYTNYGSGTGVLFGIQPERRNSIGTIVSLSIEYYLRKIESKE